MQLPSGGVTTNASEKTNKTTSTNKQTNKQTNKPLYQRERERERESLCVLFSKAQSVGGRERVRERKRE